jgi:tetratricopeptide (TPR) repeat protein
MNTSISSPSRYRAWPGLALLALSGLTFAQAPPESPANTEQQYLDLIEQREEEGGIIDPELIEPLTALGEAYYAQQDYERAAESFERARTIMRVNTGFDTPQELPLLARQVAAEEARGNLAVAWELEQGLLQLATLNLDSLDTLPIFIAAAEKRFDIWYRYMDGDHPPEIELGCYYDQRKYIRYMLQRLPQLGIVSDSRANCNSGDRETVVLSLLIEGRSFQMRGVETLLRNGRYASDELKQLVTEVLRSSHAIARRQLSSADPALSEMMLRLLAQEPEDSASAVRRAEFLLQLADMNVIRARQARRMAGFAAVHEQYEQVWQALQAEGVDAAALNALFAPTIPVVLPSYAVNPLATVSEAEATGYVDVAFRITDKGTTRNVEILGSSANVPRSAIRKLQRIVDMSSFRPRMTDGKVADLAPVTVRYYVSGPAPEPDDAEACETRNPAGGCQ